MHKKPLFWIVLILLVGTAVRIYNLTAISLWHDEAFSALLINYPWHEMLARIGLDVHPPIYYIALRLWADIFGHGLGSLRGFSALFGVGTIWASYLFMRTAFKNEKLALTAAFLIAINPFQIQYVTEARMYTFGAFFVMLSAYLVVKALEAQKKYFEYKTEMKDTSGRVSDMVWLYWFLFALTTSVTMYTHYYLFFSVLAIGLFVVYDLIKTYGWKLSAYRYAFLSYVLVLVLYIPWLQTFLFQFHQVQENYWIPKITKWSVPLTNWKMLAGASADASKQTTQIMISLGVLFTIYMLYRVFKKHTTVYKSMVVFGLIVPFLGALALSVRQSIYLDRYFLFAALFYTFALCLFIFDIRNHKVRNVILSAVIILSIFNYLKDWHDLDVKNHQGMSAAAQFLNTNVSAGDHLAVSTSFEFFNFRYYNHTPVNALFYAQGIRQVSDLPHFSGTAILTDADLIHDLNHGAKPGEIGWIVWTNAFGGSKPSVPSNWEQIDERNWADVRPYSGTLIYVTEYRIK